MKEKKIVVQMDIDANKSIIKINEDNSMSLVLKKLSNGAMVLCEPRDSFPVPRNQKNSRQKSGGGFRLVTNLLILYLITFYILNTYKSVFGLPSQ